MRSRHLVLGLAVAALLAGLSAVLLRQSSSDGTPRASRTTTTITDTSTMVSTSTAPSTTSTSSPPPPPPTVVVAYRESDSTTILLDLAEGEARPLAPGSDVEPYYAGPADGSLYLHRSLHPAEVAAIDIDSGQSDVIGPGSWPAVTSDGRLLAYATGGAPSREDYITVRDVRTGSERRFATKTPASAGDAAYVHVSQLSWSASGTELAFRWTLGSFDDDRVGRVEIRVLDVTSDADLDQARSFVPSDPTKTWSNPTFRGRFGSLAVVESAQSETEPGASVLALDPSSGEVLATLFKTDTPIRSLDADASGFHLLYSVETPVDDRTAAYRRDLYAWHGGDPELIGRGLTNGAWQ